MADTGSGAYTDVQTYDTQYRPLSETWGGTDPNAVPGGYAYDWQGDQLNTTTVTSNGATVEVDTMRYNCSTARTARVPRIRAGVSQMRLYR
jgi:hypothetical protein